MRYRHYGEYLAARRIPPLRIEPTPKRPGDLILTGSGFVRAR